MQIPGRIRRGDSQQKNELHRPQTLRAPNYRLRRASEGELQLLYPAQPRMRECEAAFKSRVGEQFLIERSVIERQDIRHTILALQDLAQLTDDSGGVALAQAGDNQLPTGEVRQRDLSGSIEREINVHGRVTGLRLLRWRRD